MKKVIWFLWICFLAGPFANAQADLHNTGILFLSNSTDTLYINGSFTNTSATALSNNGIIHIKQNLINDQASMPAGTGTLYLNGTAAQTVSGGQVFKTYNLVTNNAAGITLNNNLSAGGVHTYTNGMITTSVTPNYMIYEAGSSYAGSGDTRHVNGWIKKNGNTDFIFPSGDAAYQRTLAISNLSATAEINCRYYTPTSNIYNLWSPLVQVKANEYWQLDKISGGTAQITFNWDHAKVPMDNILLPDILSSQYISGNWTSTGGSASGDITTTGMVTSNPLSTFGPVTIAYKSFPVPLKLISFTAERRTGTSFLTWITENEENVDHFDVQRSYNASTYTSIGNVAAQNTARQVYHYQDHSPLNGMAYYRIRSVDADGKIGYSKIAVLSENNIQSAGFFVLNPARSVITIFNKTGQDGQFNYRLLNATGQALLSGSINMNNNGGSVLLLPSQTTAGIYILELTNQQTTFRQKILVEK